MASDYGKMFNFLGTSYKLVGFNTRRIKFPLIAERQPDGKIFSVPLKAFEKGN